MVKLKVVWSPTAVDQLQQIILFYNTRNNNTKYSQYIVRIIKESLKLISCFPYMYRATSLPTTRCFPCEYFRVYYSIYSEHILVEAVFDTRQDPEKIPFQ
ncbi:MAG: type II toxin-antitoxin system RelE/ParE family toxin [Bacteroides sp.]|uniref:type II toxin-antitoxin system RelE/ParE family toxin n=1 Tax=Bacteroides sp. TaxID=29523 RepID=UPI0025BCB6BF|nr:type II toxin-antitoxin system RelE/ParE family toxin [Bacteroides sp.]MBS6237151.1 type II toxin-antitoxin system RelE/ParE family toxin [Bacteroides sp.]